MRLSEIAQRLRAEAVFIPNGSDPEVCCVCASDLLSDILATDKQDFIILTGLINPQVIRTAEIVGALAVFIVRGKVPSHEIVGLAQAHQIPLYTIRYPMFESCALLADVLEECRESRNCPVLSGA